MSRIELARRLMGIATETPALAELPELLRSGRQDVTLSGLAGSIKSLVVGHLRQSSMAGILVLVPREEDAAAWAGDLSFWIGPKAVYHFPDPETIPYGVQSTPDELVSERLRALRALKDEARPVVVASYSAVLRYLPPPENLLGLCRTALVGEPGEPTDLAVDLARQGYDQVPKVEELGQFSLRGGIVDVYPHFSADPVRVEFGEDRIDSMRTFAPSTQRSLAHLDGILIPPRREVLPPRGSGARACSLLDELDGGSARDSERLRHVLSEEIFFEGIEWYLPFFFPEVSLITAYAGHDLMVVMDEPHRLNEAAENVLARATAIYEEKRQGNYFAFPPEKLFAREKILSAALAGRPTLKLHQLPQPVSETSLQLGSRSGEPFGSNLNMVREWLHQVTREGRKVFILSPTRVQAERLAVALESDELRPEIGVGSLSSGFSLPERKLELLTDRELYGRVSRPLRLPRFRGSGPVRDILALSRGDFVVHVHHGIGRYSGTEKVTAGGTESECVRIEYANGDRVLVPIQQLGLLEKYSNPDGPAPPLSRLGTAAWERTKTRAKKAIKDMAQELMRLYGERRARPGHAFPADTPWQRELEATFPYEETPDQLKAAEEVKRDMENQKPMDRLICGDVGFGKTEVAIRAAFKAVMDGKQVAVLVPTTILAQQHLNTFRQRLSPFPVRVEMLSRFLTTREQKRVASEVTAGQVDIVIGTHRLLSRDIHLRDLGLLIIDEEQRFGVAHKERLKSMRSTVDVLTMTATPIPRTLHLSLMGARDLSVMETPPRDRLSIHTEIVPFDREIITGAILKEVERGGQVFFVHNRVQSIHSMARLLSDLLPQVRVGVAHGQMPERELERAMLDFLDQRHDVLVSTMIIESGLDMPRVNTMVVNRADRFGLAQLYQLRGRVGRSTQRAYAYLLLPPQRRLTEDAEKRLAVIAESTELGSGMRLAMHDLEIRGAGNVLGREQHGFLMQVGMELYCRLLDEAVAELRGETPEERIETRLDTDLGAFLPESYVEDGGERVAIYRRLIRIRQPEEIAELDEELADRFGPVPPAAKNLLGLQKIKIMAEQAGMEEVGIRREGLTLKFPASKVPSRDRLERFLAAVDFPLEFAGQPGLMVKVTIPEGEPAVRLASVEKCVVSLGAP